MNSNSLKNGEVLSMAAHESRESRPRTSWNGEALTHTSAEMDRLQLFRDEHRPPTSSPGSVGSVPKWFDSMLKCDRGSRSSSQERMAPRTAEPATRVFDLDLAGATRLRTTSGLRARHLSEEVDLDLAAGSRRGSRDQELVEVERPRREGSARYGRRAAGTPKTPDSSRNTGTASSDSSSGRLSSPKAIPEDWLDTMPGHSVLSPIPSSRGDLSSPSAGTTGPHFWEAAAPGLPTVVHNPASLEESWSHLQMFNRQQRGRISSLQTDSELYQLGRERFAGAKLALLPQVDEGAESSCEEEDFFIPELPRGKNLTINIRSTWGDRHYVGLNGIEMFSASGEPIKVDKISADPADINVLDEYSGDPRVVSNLTDGVYRTRDDMHLWLAPFTPGGDHLVNVRFAHTSQLAMLRIWNYNKSRCHSFRGARHVDVTLDGKTIFSGEIARACGGILGGTEAFGDTILFTTDDEILDNISQFDESFGSYCADPTATIHAELPVDRPRTADIDESGGRPFTSGHALTETQSRVPQLSSAEIVNFDSSGSVPRGQIIQLTFTSSWGDRHQLGLTGLEIIKDNQKAIQLKASQLTASTATTTLPRLLDDERLTSDPEHMWLVPWKEGQSVTVIVRLAAVTPIAALRVWNYNASQEDSYKGARNCIVSVDNKRVSPAEGFVLRRAPGNTHYNFSQEVALTKAPAGSAARRHEKPKKGRTHVRISDSVYQDEYEAPMMPQGFVFQFHLLSTWGDLYYTGLNGIELYDAAGHKIPLTDKNVAAFPDSVNVLDNVTGDVRTPDKLVDGVNSTLDGRHMWLAPILPDMINRIYIIFDEIQTVSMIKIWNYAKTPARGVKEFGLLVDDLLVYNGQLGQIAGGPARLVGQPVPYHTVLFTSDRELIQRERNTVIRPMSAGENEVRMLNNNRGTSSAMTAQIGSSVDQMRRPFTQQTPAAALGGHRRMPLKT
ncbi:katanin-interacting protein-like [Amphibalanus amphitrite]|uniref:katanin-interacting protein-like n=1 Tax=Amphibalanus amphitrite TaxID=1232801 RepID=UPI001C8FBCEB|nr:katanin-interacting protein-like [Amphibalanus amphitrite]